jgi:hypothetical protein
VRKTHGDFLYATCVSRDVVDVDTSMYPRVNAVNRINRIISTIHTRDDELKTNPLAVLLGGRKLSALSSARVALARAQPQQHPRRTGDLALNSALVRSAVSTVLAHGKSCSFSFCECCGQLLQSCAHIGTFKQLLLLLLLQVFFFSEGPYTRHRQVQPRVPCKSSDMPVISRRKASLQNGQNA